MTIKELILKIENMRYNESLLQRIKKILPQGYIIQEIEHNELCEELWNVLENNKPILQIEVFEEPYENEKYIIDVCRYDERGNVFKDYLNQMD